MKDQNQYDITLYTNEEICVNENLCQIEHYNQITTIRKQVYLLYITQKLSYIMKNTLDGYKSKFYTRNEQKSNESK